MARTAETEILPIWHSDATIAVLYAVFRGPAHPTAAAIAADVGMSRPAINDEVRRLVTAGLIRRERVGRSELLEAVDEHPAINPLRVLVDLTVGPLVELRRLYEIAGVEEVSVFGSWARRHLGEPGLRPNDIDVLVVGSPEFFSVDEVCVELSGRYAIDVMPTVASRGAIAADPVLSAILAGPRVRVRP